MLARAESLDAHARSTLIAVRFVVGLERDDAFPFDLKDLRPIEPAILNDVLACVGARSRTGVSPAWAALVPDGAARIALLLQRASASGGPAGEPRG
jgi:hypothetical protein